MKTESGYLSSGDARIYYETTGQDVPFVMIHAGVADSRQWSGEFTRFAPAYRVIRYDMRGFGQSQPVAGDYTNLTDLTALLDALGINEPAVLMGCSMGGALALEFALAHPSRAKALILVGSAPEGLELDAPEPPIFAEAEAAFKAGDFDRLLELETQIWYDGTTGTSSHANPEGRRLAVEMNRLALAHHQKGLGKRLPDATTPAAGRLEEINAPVLVIVGEYDAPYLLAAADVMVERLPNARKVMIADAAHLPNLNHPAEFQTVVEEFLAELG